MRTGGHERCEARKDWNQASHPGGTMDIRQIKYFVALYEEGSITKSAQRMHVVQPAISQQIKKLETEFGVSLFERTPQGVVANAVAHEFYARCISILKEVERAGVLLYDSSARLAGKVTVGSQASINQIIMGRALAQYSELFPGVEVLARDGYRSDLITWLNQGELDFALLSAVGNSLEMQVEAFSREDMIVVGHRDTLGDRDLLDGTEIANFKLVLPSRHKSIRHLLDAQFGAFGIALRPRLEVDAIQSLFQIVKNTGWISITPATAFSPEMFDGTIKCVRLQHPIVRRNVVVAWPRHKELSVPAQRLIRLLKDMLALHTGVEVTPENGG